MRYYLSEVTVYNDGTKDKLAMYSFEDIVSAKASYHGRMSSMMKSENVKTGLILVYDEQGTVVVVDKYSAFDSWDGLENYEGELQ